MEENKKKTRKELLQIIKDRDYEAAQERADELIDEYVPTDIGKKAAKVVADEIIPDDDLEAAFSVIPAGAAAKLGKRIFKMTRAGIDLMNKMSDSKTPEIPKSRPDRPENVKTVIFVSPDAKKETKEIYTPDIFKPRESKPVVIREVKIGGKEQSTSPSKPVQEVKTTPKVEEEGSKLNYEEFRNPSRLEAEAAKRKLERYRSFLGAIERGEVRDPKIKHRMQLTKTKSEE